MKPLCIYHGNCADGFTSAWAVWKALGDECEFFPGVYQDAPPDVTGRDVIMVDFSYKRAALQEMCQPRGANSMLILDHHKTAEADLKSLRGVDMAAWTKPLGWQRYLDCVAQDDMENANCNGALVYQIFDMERSGAGLTWDFFHGGKRPALVQYVEDRDLWRFKLPLSREVNAFIFSYDYDFKTWDFINASMSDHMGVQNVADQGGAIERKHHKDIAELVKVTKRRMVIGGHEVWVANLPYTLTSDAGHLMAKGAPFAACYWDTPDGRVFSLRSTDEGLDVSEIAKAYGGGGHRNASGFRLAHGATP
jgi:oligoribonuclease NrnB/cAMP/cGMP phosphodiesterase (DHH superfamily)